MRPVVVSAPASTGDSSPIVVDYHLAPQNIGLAVTFPNSATATCSVRYSLDDPYASYATSYAANATWFDVTGMTGLAAATSGTPTIPARAFKLTNTAWTSGQPTLTLVQTGGIA